MTTRVTPSVKNSASAEARDLRAIGWEGLARSASRSFVSADSAPDRRELLVIGAGEGAYAIPVERVREIVRLAAITRVPRMPDWLVGVVPLRGEVIEVVDLRRRLGLASVGATRSSRIVVIHGDNDGIAGVLVDSVKGVMRVPESDVLPAQGHDFRSIVEMFRSGESFVGILDLERVVGLADD